MSAAFVSYASLLLTFKYNVGDSLSLAVQQPHTTKSRHEELDTNNS